jgi:hypothetical protein
MSDMMLLLYNRAEKAASKLNKPEMCIYKSAAVPTIHRFPNISGTAQTTVSGLYDRHTLMLMLHNIKDMAGMPKC